MWKCHIYCSNPIRPKERSSTSCSGDNIQEGGCKGGLEITKEVDVSDACWEDRKKSCEVAKVSYLDGCDVDCNMASSLHHQFHGMIVISLLFLGMVAYW